MCTQLGLGKWGLCILSLVAWNENLVTDQITYVCRTEVNNVKSVSLVYNNNIYIYIIQSSKK